MKILLMLTLLFINLTLACKDINCINCAIDPNNCKTCKPGFKATQGYC